MSEKNLFKTHILDQEGLDKMRKIALAFEKFCEELSFLTINGSPREWAISKTNLETACFFAKKSIAINHDTSSESCHPACPNSEESK